MNANTSVCAPLAEKRRVRRPRLASVRETVYTRQKFADCMLSRFDGRICQADMCAAQQLARKCGLDARNERDYAIIMQFCDAYHDGYYAGFDAGYQYVVNGLGK